MHVNWRKEPHLRKLYLMSVFLLVASATTGYDGMLMNAAQQMDKFKEYYRDHGNVFQFEDGDWNKDENLLGIMVNMFNIGSILSFFITPYAADRFGRKPTIMAGCVVMILGALISAFTNGYGMWLAGRFLLGFGNSPPRCALPSFSPRSAILSIVVPSPPSTTACGTWAPSSSPSSAGVPPRSTATGAGGPSPSSRPSLHLPALRCLVDSRVPRYLVSKDKPDQAFDVLVKHHGGGNSANATVQFEFREIKETIVMEAQANRSTSYMDFFRTKGNRWRLAIVISLGIISQYSGNALFSNYIDDIYSNAGIREQNQKLALTAGKTILDLIISIGAALTVDKIGRRPLFLFAISGMVGSFVCWTITGAIYENSGETNRSSGYAQVVFIWFFGIFYDIGFSGLLVAYALEVLPFALRAKGMMILNITIQAILALGNQTNLLAWNRLPNHWNFMLFYTLWDFCELIFVWFFYIETKGPTLEEIARIFDGDDAVTAHIDLEQVEKEIRVAEHEEDINRRNTESGKTAA
ncbi:unnamed protein product [Parascedosporium putredinis]|uniref:Major facilitator superfamily (MFS) profile domain-containing protein n=1 Tax=Parascedosporium putredinis TaxID=1442378 RepID=A0A9P1GZJ8_9PEZI|nr:unnamed protein product [Parascedosporium putredinis]CAI7991850.1 unnamed protein product [Parascedosporium putredinis]